jgi:hypothetical protein
MHWSSKSVDLAEGSLEKAVTASEVVSQRVNPGLWIYLLLLRASVPCITSDIPDIEPLPFLVHSRVVNI